MKFPIADYFDTFGKAQKVYAKQLEPVCKHHDLTKKEVDVLLFLHNNPEFDRAADIVSHRGMAKSHVSLAVSTLEARGFVLRQTGEADRRAAHLRLTETGLAIAREAAQLQEAFFSRLYQGVDLKILEQWGRASQTIRENINHME